MSKLSIFILGFSALLGQLVLLRELAALSAGNEFTIGILLAAWAVAAGVGGWVGDCIKEIRATQLALGVAPFLSLILFRFMKGALVLPGELIGPVKLFVFGAAFVFPTAFIAGLLFAFNIRRNRETYKIESLGSLVAGALFSFFFSWWVGPIGCALLIMALNFFVVDWRLVVIPVTLIAMPLESTTLGWMFQNVTAWATSPYGNLVVADGGSSFYENGRILFSREELVEETVHYAMAQRKAKKVLLISGGSPRPLEELAKYGVSIDWVVLDPKMLRLQETTFAGRVITSDGRRWIEKSGDYDVVILDIGDPATLGVNRFFTFEFFEAVKKKLNGGVLSLSLAASENYWSTETTEAQSSIYSTLKKVFLNVIVIPGDRTFFLASDSPLSYEIGKKLNDLGIRTEYVNDDYLKAKLSDERIQKAQAMLATVEPNADLRPTAFFSYLRHWLAQYETAALGGLLLLMVLFLLNANRIERGIFLIGLSGMAIEVVALLGIQISEGLMYGMMGLAFGMFMAGLVAGSEAKTRLQDALLGLGGVALLLCLLLLFRMPWFFFLVVIFGSGVLVGATYMCALRKGKGGKLYAWDLVGGAIGSFVVLFLPFGVTEVCAALVVLNLAASRL